MKDWNEKTKRFPLSTVVEYGEMPYPHFAGLDTFAIEKAFSALLKDGESLDQILRELWISKQEGKTQIPAIVHRVRFEDIDQLQTCINAVIDFQNHLPCWELRGNSSDEILQKARKAISLSGRMP